jgi:hypothetical protein
MMPDDVTGRQKLPFEKDEKTLAEELLKVLDGVSIRCATNALDHAIQLLSTTQVVNSKSPLLQISELQEACHQISGTSRSRPRRANPE